MTDWPGWLGSPQVEGGTTAATSSSVVLRFPEGDPPLRLVVDVSEIDGVPQIKRLTVDVDQERAAITSDLLRSLPLKRLKEAVLAEADRHDEAQGLPPASRIGRGLKQPRQHFVQVARLYEEAVALGRSPLRAIQEYFNVERSTASKYVRRARDLELLGYPAAKGVVGTAKKESPFRVTAPMQGSPGFSEQPPEKEDA